MTKLALMMPIVSGILLACGQFFMKRLAVALPNATLVPLAIAVITSPFLYAFVTLNCVATVAYVSSLRYMSMTNTFAIVFVAMGATVLSLDVFVNRTTLSGLNLFGVGLGMGAVLLISAR